MRFLVDECTGPKVAHWLRNQGHEVFREHHSHRGVVFLRLLDERSAKKIDAIRRLLESYADQLADRFVVVTESQVRFSPATP